MGVPGLWDVLRPTGEVRSLTHLGIESGFVANEHGHRAYRIGIDASIWFFHAQGGREGENPELRTLFFRCCRLLAMPFLPIFVFDGPQRPKIKRGKAIGGKEHWLVNSLRTVLDAFGFECRTAPGEAEAELAFLNRAGVIDAVLSDDVDCFLFGALTVIRNSSATLSGNKAHSVKNADGKEDGQHVHIYHTDDVLANPGVRLSQGGLILIALLRGGDYDQHGIDGCGITIAHALALAGFGDTLLAAARSPNPDILQTLLPSWRTALRHEIRTNASGLAPRKSPTLAQRITDDFPRLDVLRCYTHPVTSEARMRGLDALWGKRPCIAKIARVCEMYFEWGVEPTVVKRFRNFLWPGAVLRGLLQEALDKDQERREKGKTSSNENRTVDGVVETPSKTLARTLDRMALTTGRESDSEDEGNDIIRAIHGERRHASTDHVLEYRLEIRPSEFVRQARAGITGSRVEMGDSAPGGVEDENDDDDDGGEDGDSPKKGKGKKPPPNPESALRVWMPAVMVAYVCPGLVAEWEEKKRGKQARKAMKGKAMETNKKGTKVWDREDRNPGTPEKSTARTVARREQDSDDQRSVVKKAPIKFKAGKTKPVKVYRAEAEESDEASTVVKKAFGSAKAKQLPSEKSSTSTSTASDSDSGSRSRSVLQLLDDADPFLVSSAPAGPTKARPTVGDVEGTDSQAVLTLRPFPMSIATSTRKHSTPSVTSSSSSSHDGARARFKRSPRKSQEHAFSRKRSPAPRMAPRAREPSPSPARPPFRAHMKPLHMTARPVGSTTADDVIVISSDSDTPAQHPNVKVHKTKVAVGAKYHQVGIKSGVPSSSKMVPNSDIIDLT